MADSLFLLGGDGSLRTMTPAPFDSEDVFQALLERHPALLTSSTFGEAEPRRWVLVRREMSVGDSADSSGRWSLDHLFLDQDGVPTLVEIKRASDTRARREVVAQMLDYAANAVSWWRVSDLVEHFQSTAAAAGRSSQDLLAELMQDETADEEAFWRKVQANLTSGRIRMLFVADVIHPELQRIVEFLNEQMNPAVVAALELRPFVSGGDRLISPRVIGETQKAQAAKTLTKPIELPHTLEEWIAVAAPDARGSALRFIGLAKETGLELAQARRSIRIDTAKAILAYLGPTEFASYIQIAFASLRNAKEFTSSEARRVLFVELSDCLRPSSKRPNLDGWPGFYLPSEDDEARWTKLKEMMGRLAAALDEGTPHA